MVGNLQLFCPDRKSDPSHRVVLNELLPFNPITIVSFDCLAFPVEERSVTLNQVVQMEWISHLGWPLYVSSVHCIENACAHLRVDLALTMTAYL